MKYENVIPATFLKRPNRFIAHVAIQGEEAVCHVKNTGRCRELLVPGAKVYLEKTKNPKRKTQYDLIAVEKGGLLINMDSQAPNRVVKEWLASENCIEALQNLTFIKPEYAYGSSRFDFYMERSSQRILMEVKGVTLEEDGAVLFPDAPTERGVKHVYELCEARKANIEAWIFFVIQMKGVKFFAPNWKTHEAFGNALRYAQDKGVRIVAYDCQVTPDFLQIADPVAIRL